MARYVGTPGVKSLKRISAGALFNREVVGVYVGNAVATTCVLAQDIWVASVIRGDVLTPRGAGWLASGQMFCVLLSILAVSQWGGRSKPKVLAAAAGGVMGGGNAIASMGSATAIVVGNVLAGVGAGALFATVLRIAVRQQH